MGFQSEGKGQGSLFFFELPLFADDLGSMSFTALQSLSSMFPTSKSSVFPFDVGVDDQMESGSLPPLQISETEVDLIHPFVIKNKNPVNASLFISDASQSKSKHNYIGMIFSKYIFVFLQNAIVDSAHSNEFQLSSSESTHHKPWNPLSSHAIEIMKGTDHLLPMRFLVVVHLLM